MQINLPPLAAHAKMENEKGEKYVSEKMADSEGINYWTETAVIPL